jgi:hypothetical protein
MIPQVLHPPASAPTNEERGREKSTNESYDFLPQSVCHGFGEGAPVLFTPVQTMEDHEGSTACRGFGSVGVGRERDGLPGGAGG